MTDEACIACGKPMLPGQAYFPDASGGPIHAACCGPERESYTGVDGEPLADGAPIPTPLTWVSDEQKADLAVLAVKELGAMLSMKPHSRDPHLADRYFEWVQGVERVHAKVRDALSARLADAVQPAAGEGGMREALARAENAEAEREAMRDLLMAERRARAALSTSVPVAKEGGL